MRLGRVAAAENEKYPRWLLLSTSQRQQLSLKNGTVTIQNQPGDEYYILGDTNINMEGNSSRSTLLQKLDQMLTFFDISQLILEPTRITAFLSSIIDHIFTNSPEKVKESGVIPVGFSDHFLTLLNHMNISFH